MISPSYPSVDPNLSQTGVPELDELFREPPEDGGVVTTGEVVLKPTEARELIFRTGWRAQRSMSTRQVNMLADSFRHDEFLEYSLLSFGFLPNGNLVMVDGQHRLEASIRAAWTGPWLVRLDWNTSAYDLYARLDSYQIRRTAAIQGQGYQDDELEPWMRQRGMEAARWQLRWSRSYVLPPGCMEPPLRDMRAQMQARMEQLVGAEELGKEEGVSPKIYRKLARSAVLAVVVETLYVMPEEAREFWLRVLRLQPGMSQELAQVLLEPPPVRQTASYLPRMAAQAWNRRADPSGRLRQGAQRPVLLGGSELRVGKVSPVASDPDEMVGR